MATDLDSLKQDLTRRMEGALEALRREFGGLRTGRASPAPVSYTHLDVYKRQAYPGTGRNVADELVHLVATIGENMILRRVAVVNVPGGVAASYMHGALKPGLGKIGVIVGLSGKADAGIEDLGKKIGMHVAASPKTEALTIAEVDPAALELSLIHI